MKIPNPIRWLSAHPVTRSHPWRTWSRWLYWQTRQRFTKTPKVMPFFNGTKLAVYPKEGLTGYWYVVFPDYVEMSFLARFLRSGDVFYDIGANAGAYSIFAAGAGCEVYAFAPVPSSFGRLKENIDLNEAGDRVAATNLALGSSRGSLWITTELGTGNRVLAPGETTASVEVPVDTLDDLAAELPPPNFLKIDVEGHELEVIRGALYCLANRSVAGLLIETFRPHRWQDPSLVELEKILREQGFRPFEYEPDGNRLVALDSPWLGRENTFYLRDPDLVRDRLKSP